ncbi:MAG TPA: hypothetical protein PKO10_06455, partial [Aliarcobacter cryaerophilus]|nr:hypothetical protein [Aliarcobacter cryaerophilus]
CGHLPEMNSFNMYNVCKDLFAQIPTVILNSLFIDEVKKRKSNTQIIKSFPIELRYVCLSMNISQNRYRLLENKLENKIRI